MLPVVIQPDVELWAAGDGREGRPTGFLVTALAARPEPYADAMVTIKLPSSLPERVVWVRRDGGPRLDLVREAARLSVNVLTTTEQDATDLARLVAALLWAAPDGAPVVKVAQLSGPSVVADPSGRPRRFMTFEITVRGEQA